MKAPKHLHSGHLVADKQIHAAGNKVCMIKYCNTRSLKMLQSSTHFSIMNPRPIAELETALDSLYLVKWPRNDPKDSRYKYTGSSESESPSEFSEEPVEESTLSDDGPEPKVLGEDGAADAWCVLLEA